MDKSNREKLDMIRQFLIENGGSPSALEDVLKGQKATVSSQRHWFDRKLCGLPKDARKKLEEDEEALNSPFSNHVDRKQVRYAQKFKRMPFRVPDFYRKEVTPQLLYKRLIQCCRSNDLPEEIVAKMVPSLINYIHTGHARPVMLIGEKGSGKSTALKLLVSEALQLPMVKINVSQFDGSHGLTGDCGSYQSADAGYLAKTQILNDSLIVSYFIDEIDKCSHPVHRASIDDELLSITDESVEHVEDKYLEFELVSLPFCPIFFAGNDLNQVNKILADRCTVIQYPSATAPRIKSILTKYVQKKLNEATYTMIEFDYELMNKSVDALVERNVRSIRKHQKLIECVLNIAFNETMVKDLAHVRVTPGMFTQAEREILCEDQRKMGFTT